MSTPRAPWDKSFAGRAPNSGGMSPPPAVFDLAARLGAAAPDDAPNVELTQTGRMKAKLDGPSWMAFTARQTLSTQHCGFDWRAKFGRLGLLAARDALVAGEGCFELTALGLIPLARAKPSSELIRGELMRYLAELAWAPGALLGNSSLRWRTNGSDQLVVAAGAEDTLVEVTLDLDADGRIASAFAPDRPRSVGAGFVPTPWRGRFFDYRRHEGQWLPFAGEVAWVIDGQDVVYWQGRLTQWRRFDPGTDAPSAIPKRTGAESDFSAFRHSLPARDNQ